MNAPSARTVAAPRDPDRAHDREAVAAGHRVVVIAVEQQRVDRRADLSRRRLDDAEAQIARSVFDAEQILRQPAVGREDDDAARMRVLFRLRVPGVAEAGGLRQPIDLRLIAGQEMPAFGGAGAPVALEVDGLLRRRRGRRVVRVEADGDDLEILARIQRHHAERARQAVDHLRAQHRAVVVREHHHHRLAAEVVAETHGRARLVAERRVERHALVDVLIEADLAQRLRQRGRHDAGLLLVAGRRRAGRHLGVELFYRRDRKERRDQKRKALCVLGELRGFIRTFIASARFSRAARARA